MEEEEDGEAGAEAAEAEAAAGACVVCGMDDDSGVHCDGCDAWFHTNCVGLADLPEAPEWFCPLCDN